ncbi:uncharacterized protein ColSpa_03787 [Colletotrichum spaethianum]|uniref:Uncharacterized protein n=1 Tax=Colletotrichum spaethianum TaxID=700344 RepID=A0AA37L873_9PEZI|nr:uncharacterized protein ColSpa_03787 [Colletotrichum spaethianum]GKT43606.1 hypothetical protein ColSpa_03787 [Colletotrichum spaethianum]
MKSYLIVTLIGTLAATINGIPIIDNANVAGTKTAQTGTASNGVVYGLGPHRFDNIQGPDGKLPGSIVGIHSSSLDAPIPTEIKFGTFWPTHTATGTFTGPYTIHTTGTEAAPATFETMITERKAKMTPTVCILRYDPNSTRVNECLGQGSEISNTKHTQTTNTPIPTIISTASPTITSSTRIGYDKYWWILCGQFSIGARPAECAIMTPSPFATGPEPTLELTTISSMILPTPINKDTTSTEAWMELTTISSMITSIPFNKDTSTTSELFMVLTTITSLMDPTLTDKDVMSTTTISIVAQTNHPETDYTFTKIDSAPVATGSG